MNWDPAAVENEQLDADLGRLPQDLLQFSGLVPFPQPDPQAEMMASMAERHPVYSYSTSPELESVNYANYTSWHGAEHNPTSQLPPNHFQSAFSPSLGMLPSTLPPASGPVELVPYSVPPTASVHSVDPSHTFNVLDPSFNHVSSAVPQPASQFSYAQAHSLHGAGSQGPNHTQQAMHDHFLSNLQPLASHPQYVDASLIAATAGAQVNRPIAETTLPTARRKRLLKCRVPSNIADAQLPKSETHYSFEDLKHMTNLAPELRG
jgi:hypothetical protein